MSERGLFEFAITVLIYDRKIKGYTKYFKYCLMHSRKFDETKLEFKKKIRISSILYGLCRDPVKSNIIQGIKFL